MDIINAIVARSVREGVLPEVEKADVVKVAANLCTESMREEDIASIVNSVLQVPENERSGLPVQMQWLHVMEATVETRVRVIREASLVPTQERERIVHQALGITRATFQPRRISR